MSDALEKTAGTNLAARSREYSKNRGQFHYRVGVGILLTFRGSGQRSADRGVELHDSGIGTVHETHGERVFRADQVVAIDQGLLFGNNAGWLKLRGPNELLEGKS